MKPKADVDKERATVQSQMERNFKIVGLEAVIKNHIIGSGWDNLLIDQFFNFESFIFKIWDVIFKTHFFINIYITTADTGQIYYYLYW